MTRDDHDDHQPLIIDPKSTELPMDYSASKSCSLEKKSGNKCYMIGARELTITWGDTPQYWKWTSCSESRFSEIASLQSVWWLDIRGKIDTQLLSGKTTYGAYLVFNLSKKFGGLGSANAVVRFVDHEAVSDAEKRANLLHLKGASYGGQSSYESVVQRRRFAKGRGDGWMEIELGSFYNGVGDDGEVEARLMETNLHVEKFGLLVRGIEFRPKDVLQQLDQLSSKTHKMTAKEEDKAKDCCNS